MRNQGRKTVTAIAATQVAQTIIGWFIWLLNVLFKSPFTRISESYSVGSFSYSKTSTSQRNFTFDASRLQNKCPLSRLSKLQMGSVGTEMNRKKMKLILLTLEIISHDERDNKFDLAKFSTSCFANSTQKNQIKINQLTEVVERWFDGEEKKVISSSNSFSAFQYSVIASNRFTLDKWFLSINILACVRRQRW